MSSAAAIGVLPEQLAVRDRCRTFAAMAGQVSVRISRPGPDAEQLIDAVAEVFAAVERECTRFDQNSDLMRANAAGEQWQVIGPYCFDAIGEAARAHRLSDGRFDPRVLESLTSLGYDRTLAFEGEQIELAGRHRRPEPERDPGWAPGLDATLRAVRVGSRPIDLGGIGKGLAVRWAAARIAAGAGDFLIEAGGDCYLAGHGPAGAGWQVGIENPLTGTEPIAVLTVTDRAVATSSTRIRSWTVGGRRVHHLIDPRTGQPGGDGLSAVTVVHPDPATAEVWSKVLFLHGRTGIAAAAEQHQLAAAWVGDDGELSHSPLLGPHLLWVAP